MSRLIPGIPVSLPCKSEVLFYSGHITAEPQLKRLDQPAVSVTPAACHGHGHYKTASSPGARTLFSGER